MPRFKSPNRANTSVSIKKDMISAPLIPAEEEEFPIRTPGASIATPLGEDAGNRGAIAHESAYFPRNAPEVVVEEPIIREDSLSPPPQQFEQDAQVHQEQEVGPRRSTGSIRSRTSIIKPQRKKSTLKTMFGKLFGRKRKGSGSTASKRQSTISNAQHRSNPVPSKRAPNPDNYASQRSVSLPINEYNRALRSHSVILEDFPLRASYQPTQESPKAETNFTRPRGATTPSRSYNLIKTPLYADWTGLTPRPASSHARGSKTNSGADIEEVGVAVTSDTHMNRRSRSLGELRGIMQDHTTRRRSDEIKYWRQSHDQSALSPSSGFKQEDDTLVNDEAETSSNKENFAPPEPFNFEPHLTEMAGMKITQAASLESRVSQLEHRFINIERYIHHMQGVSSARPATPTSEASLPKHIHRASPQRPIRASQSRDARSFSFVSSQPSLGAYQVSQQPSFESYVAPIDPPLGTYHHNLPRPISTTNTVRQAPQNSSPIAERGSLSIEHYSTLVSMLNTEQAARRHLEDIVHDLQQDLYSLRTSLPLTNGYSHQNAYQDQTDSRSTHTYGNETFGLEEEVFQTPMETTNDYGENIFGEISGNRGPGFERKKTLSLGQITQNGTRKEVATNF